MSTLRKCYKEFINEDSKYNNHVSKFINYIEGKGKGDTLIVITKKDVDESIGFYHEKGKINTYSSMENYIEGVKAFYKFLVKKNYAKDIFSSIYHYQGWKNHILNKYRLKETEEREYFNKDIIIEVLSYLDNYFKNTDYYNLNRTEKRDRYTKNLATRIFIKVMLILPQKRNIIFNLNMHNFEEDFKYIVINEIRINVTNNLRKDIKQALNISKLIYTKDYKDNDNVFMYIIGEKFKAEMFNQWFCYILKQIGFDIPKNKHSYSVEVIRNTTIYNMVKNSSNPLLISKISGISLSTLENKYYKTNNNDSLLNSQINMELSKVNYYKYI
ncbi:hypothetical protein [Clostridium haemolyticum]|uniref:Uncharacterized protein n=1 Tax=Clostridium haemolyticum NCTC 9693 TaxID=1443114 RepID=A0ABR4THE7_CLOHA|nr:hypothetical protein [Clostridium haemolyticum]KEI18543.1 hypothetical protein Z960_02660 [Clostridium haemolyticum NCTC 9693]KGN04565.1 hypothetical protein Z961_02205 [Clostridium haemolyticum NCTC 8350]